MDNKRKNYKELNAKFDFRYIYPCEAEQAAEIEQICFPPNEACSREMMIDRIKVAPDFFLVAVDKETGKIAGFLNGLDSDWGAEEWHEMSLKIADPFYSEENMNRLRKSIAQMDAMGLKDYCIR